VVATASFPVTKVDVPRWFVSAPHRVSRQDDAEPYGVHHAREVGSSRTACGAPALGWPFFWDSRFVASVDACGACVRAVREAPLPDRSAAFDGLGDLLPQDTCLCGHLLTP
jgi:hypothetical protein